MTGYRPPLLRALEPDVARAPSARPPARRSGGAEGGPGTGGAGPGDVGRVRLGGRRGRARVAGGGWRVAGAASGGLMDLSPAVVTGVPQRRTRGGRAHPEAPGRGRHGPRTCREAYLSRASARPDQEVPRRGRSPDAASFGWAPEPRWRAVRLRDRAFRPVAAETPAVGPLPPYGAVAGSHGPPRVAVVVRPRAPGEAPRPTAGRRYESEAP